MLPSLLARGVMDSTEVFGTSGDSSNLSEPIKFADVIQWLECLLAKQNVAGSTPVIRSARK